MSNEFVHYVNDAQVFLLSTFEKQPSFITTYDSKELLISTGAEKEENERQRELLSREINAYIAEKLDQYYQGGILSLIVDYRSYLQAYLHEKFSCDMDLSFLLDVHDKVSDYLAESDEYSKTFKSPSVKSFFEFSKYIPYILDEKEGIYPYIDGFTGNFGFSLRNNVKKKYGTLTIIFCEDGVLAFSMSANPNKKTSILNISGTADFNHTTENAREIKRLMRLVRQG